MECVYRRVSVCVFLCDVGSVRDVWTHILIMLNICNV